MLSLINVREGVFYQKQLFNIFSDGFQLVIFSVYYNEMIIMEIGGNEKISSVVMYYLFKFDGWCDV